MNTDFKTSADWFQQLYRLSPDPTWVIENSRFVECNDAAIKTLGYTNHSEFLNLHPSEISPPFQGDGEESFAKAERMMSLARKKGLHRFEWTHTKADGTDFDVEVTLSSIVIDNRTIFFCIWRDLSERKQAEVVLNSERARLKSILNKVPEPIFVKDNEHRLVLANEAFFDMFSMDESSVIGSTLAEKVPDNERSQFLAVDRSVLDTGISDQREETLTLGGSTRTIITSKTRFIDSSGERFLVGSINDITERKQAERDQAIAATAFNAQEGMIVTDREGDILKVNKAFSEITGYSSEEVIGKNPRFLQSGQHDRDFFLDMWERITESGHWEGEIWNRRLNGEAFPEFLTITAVKNGAGMVTNYVGTFSDITQSKASADEIEHLAFYDPLTRLPNRRLLLDRLRKLQAGVNRSGNKSAILFLDLDHFKNLNDTLGHSIGDLLLQQVAERLTSCVRECDTVGRLGGDEFVVMLESLGKQSIEAGEQANLIAQKIMTSLNRPYQLDAHRYESTSSIGVTMIENSDRGVDELLKQADIAMYRAKEEGRNAIRFFDPSMQEQLNAIVELEADLYRAVDEQQFQLYYQKQVDKVGHVIGAEALIRWNHPERGLVEPTEFISHAETTSLIQPIGNWVIETACKTLQSWKKNTLASNLTLSINVSAPQFRESDFVNRIETLILDYDINPTRLKLELTESLLLVDIEKAIQKVNALNNIGIRLVLDDFGTGYSSLQYLKRLPLDQIKIDQSFIRDIETDTDDRAIVTTIVNMSKSLNVGVIAEGVETYAQKEFLINQGCNYFQGYLFGKPKPADEFIQSLRD